MPAAFSPRSARSVQCSAIGDWRLASGGVARLGFLLCPVMHAAMCPGCVCCVKVQTNSGVLTTSFCDYERLRHLVYHHYSLKTIHNFRNLLRRYVVRTKNLPQKPKPNNKNRFPSRWIEHCGSQIALETRVESEL